MEQCRAVHLSGDGKCRVTMHSTHRAALLRMQAPASLPRTAWQTLRACQGAPAVWRLLQGCLLPLPQRALPVLRPQPWRRIQETRPVHTETHEACGETQR
jgi:hypothetical protein